MKEKDFKKMPQSLQNISNLFFLKAKQLKGYENTLQIIILIIAFTSVFIDNTTLYYAAIAAVILELLLLYIKVCFEEVKLSGLEANTLSMISLSYGEAFSEQKKYFLQSLPSCFLEKIERKASAPYYATISSDSRTRLIESLQESCFYTYSLYSEILRSHSKNLAIHVLVNISLIALTIKIPQSSDFEVTRSVFLILVAFPLKDKAVELSKIMSARTKLRSIEERITGTICESQVISIISQYNLNIATAPLIPKKTYNSEKIKLEKIWKQRLKESIKNEQTII